MPRIIKDKLREGLPSKLFYLAYSNPKSIYEISVALYGKPQPQKLYRWKNWLSDPKRNYLKNVDGKWLSDSKPLYNEILNILKKKKIKLNSIEEKWIEELLDTDFRLAIAEQNTKINNRDEFDALENLLISLDLLLFKHIVPYEISKISKEKKSEQEIKDIIKTYGDSRSIEYFKNKNLNDAKREMEFQNNIMKKLLGMSYVGEYLKIIINEYFGEIKKINHFLDKVENNGVRM